ncbi:MAG: hypothetical protein LUH07_09765, partial [Lachnospiraceae bacterium]|nr:hypothetical protein [Lachnospiraceae bacterium]
FSKQLAYKFTFNTGVRVCPYCNRQFVFTVMNEDENVIRPELDHFFPQSDYPLLALSYYNLVPSCHTCNSNIKRSEVMPIQDYRHPYIQLKDDEKEFTFGYVPPSDQDRNTHITFEYNHESSKDKKTCEFFRLEKIYKEHNDVSNLLHQTYNDYPPKSFDHLCNHYNISKEDTLKMIYRPFQVSDPDNEILGKLRNDLFNIVKKEYNVGV